MEEYYEFVHFSGDYRASLERLAGTGYADFPDVLSRIEALIADDEVDTHVYHYENLRYRFPKIQKDKVKVVLGGAYYNAGCVDIRADHLRDRGYCVEIRRDLCFTHSTSSGV